MIASRGSEFESGDGERRFKCLTPSVVLVRRRSVPLDLRTGESDLCRRLDSLCRFCEQDAGERDLEVDLECDLRLRCL
jgi:hypothetical protein